MKTSPAIISFCIICCLAVAVTGCLGSVPKPPLTPTPVPTTLPPTPKGTAVPMGHYVVTEEQHNATLFVQLNNTLTLRLPENPTTGYSWNLTISPGLSLLDDSYIPSDTSGKILGSGGIHEWNLTAVAKGEQKIQGVYKKPWEPVTGNETTFTMTIVVT